MFPRLSLEELEHLCSINIKFNNVCKGYILWQIKVVNEYPNFINYRFPNTSWKTHYLLLRRMKSIYYHGDRIGFIPFDPIFINQVINMIVPYIFQLGLDQQIVNITFIDRQRNPILIVNYPSMQTIVKSASYDDIEKIVLIVNDRFAIKVLRTFKGRGRKPREGDIIKDKEDKDREDKDIIYNELTSSLGHLPIYGFTIQNGKLAIVDNRNLRDLRTIRKWKACSEFRKSELYGMLRDLNVRPPEIDQAVVDDYITGLGLNHNYISPEEIKALEYNMKWVLADISISQLCEIIKYALQEIGHII